MDDKFLEERLSSLKESYDDMPTHKNKETILQIVKKEKSKQKRKWVYHFPYVASFIGVGMIAGILLMQFIEQPSNKDYHTEKRSQKIEIEEKATDKEVEKTFEILDSFYRKREVETKSNLGLVGDQSFNLSNQRKSLNDLKDVHLESGISKEQLNKIKSLKLNEMEEQLTTPSQHVEEMSSIFNQMDEEEFAFKYVLALENYKKIYQQYMLINKSEINRLVAEYGVGKALEQLNHPKSLVSSGAIKKMADGARKNGYKFLISGNQITVDIDYSAVRKTQASILPKDYEEYMRLQEYPVFNPSKQLNTSWKELGLKLVALEQIIQKTNTPFVSKRLKDEYSYLYSTLILGQVNKPIFNESGVFISEVKEAYQYLIGEYSNTQTAKALKAEYEELSENKFLKSDNFNYKVVFLPPFMDSSDSVEQWRPWVIRNEINPLPNQLISLYKQLKEKKDSRLLGKLNAVQVMSLYFFTLNQKDFETLYYYFEEENLPSKNVFFTTIEKDKSDFSLNLDEYDYAKYIKDKSLDREGLQIFFKDGTKPALFRMVKKDHTWKVQYKPFKQ